MDRAFEERVRAVCFEAIRERQAVHGESLPIAVIQRPVVVNGEEIAVFMLQRGIHQPRRLDAALAVTTTPPKRSSEAPYDDRFEDGMLLYHYRDPRTRSERALRDAARDNEAVRSAMRARLPIIYWFGVVPGMYRPFFPAFVVEDHRDRREFSLDLTELGVPSLVGVAAEAPARAYRAQIVQARMHQARFRQAVLRAYRNCCSVCQLKRGELVEAAHIIGDSEGGEPVISNGLALCKLHHAAFDRHILGITPDLRIAIRADVLHEIDGPMLVHGLQGFHGADLAVLPTRRADHPSAAFLEKRWERFMAEAG